MDFNFLNNLKEPQLAVVGLAVLLFCFYFGLSKGVQRTFYGLTAVAAACFTFWFVYKHGDGLISKYISKREPWMPFGLAVGGGSFVYIAVRHGIGMIAGPLLKYLEASKDKKVIAGFIGMFLGGAGLYGGGSVSHQVDTMNYLNQNSKNQTANNLNKVIVRAQESMFGLFQKRTDPTMTGYRCDVIKLLALRVHNPRKAVRGELGKITRLSEFRNMLTDKSIVKAIKKDDFQYLFRNGKISQFIKNEKNRVLLRSVNWTQI